jgi:hypothetical protein
MLIISSAFSDRVGFREGKPKNMGSDDRKETGLLCNKFVVLAVALVFAAGTVAYFPGTVWAADTVESYAETSTSTAPAGRRGASPQSGDYSVAENHLQNGSAQAYGIPSLPQKGKWSFNPVMGTELDIGGTFVNSANEIFEQADTLYGITLSLHPLISDVTLTAEEQEFDDVYDRPFVMGLGFNYGLSNHEEVFGNFTYTHADSEKFDAVTFNQAAQWGNTLVSESGSDLDTTDVIVDGEFDDYSAWGLEGGYRYFYNAVSFKNLPGTLHPFGSVAIGFKMVDDIDLDLTFNGAAIDSDLTGIKYYDDSLTATGGLIVGFRYDISPGIALGFETGIRYEGDLGEDDARISQATERSSGAATTTTFAKVNDNGDRWSIPVRAGLNIRF